MLKPTTLLLQVVDRDGVAAWSHPYRRGYGIIQAHPADAFADIQPARIPVEIRHGGPVIGEVVYAEHGLGHGDDGLYAVAVIEGVPASSFATGDLYASAEIVGDIPHGGMTATRCTLRAVALVDATAGVGARPVEAWPGDVRDPLDRGAWNVRTVPAILDRAARDTPRRWDLRARSLTIHRPALLGDDLTGWIPSQIELRYSAGGRVLSVR